MPLIQGTVCSCQSLVQLAVLAVAGIGDRVPPGSVVLRVSNGAYRVGCQSELLIHFINFRMYFQNGFLNDRSGPATGDTQNGSRVGQTTRVWTNDTVKPWRDSPRPPGPTESGQQNSVREPGLRRATAESVTRPRSRFPRRSPLRRRRRPRVAPPDRPCRRPSCRAYPSRRRRSPPGR